MSAGVSDRLVSVLTTASVGDATRAILWLREQEPLPHVLAALLVSLEFAVGRAWVDECFTDEEPADSEPESTPEASA